MSSTVVVVATLVANEGSTVRIGRVLKHLVSCTDSQKDCIKAELHQDINNPLIFVIHETWQSESALDSYSISSQYTQTANELSGMNDSYTTNRLHKIVVCPYPH